MKDLEKRFRAESAHGDVLEVWLDSIHDLRLAEIFFLKEEINKPLLFVNKAPYEGGDFMGTPEARVDLLAEALERGADYIDVALKTDAKLIKKLVQGKQKAATIIVSYHNFRGTPSLEELQKNVQEAKKKGADVVKIATYVDDVSKNVILFDLLKWAGEEGIPLAAVGMGDRGNISRVMAPILGSALYYAPMDEEDATAPGQLTKADLEAIWEHLT